MSKIALTPNASGSGTFTIASPNSDTDRTLTLPDEAGTIITTASVNAPIWLATRASSNQENIADSTATVIIYNSSVIDTDGGFNTSTGKYTVPTGKGGKYYINGGFRFNSGNAVTRLVAYIYKNGTAIAEFNNPHNASSGEGSAYASIITDLSAGDVIDVRIYHNAGSAKGVFYTSGKTLFMGYRLSE